MSGLFHALQTTTNTLDAFSKAIEAQGRNVANAQTAGWAALRVSIRPAGIGEGGSYDVVDINSTSDARTDAVVQSAVADASYSQTSLTHLEPVNRLFDITGESGILGAMREFSAGFSRAAVTPGDPVRRAAALDAARGVAAAFHRTVAGLDTLRTQIDTAIQSAAAQINQAAGTIARYNERVRGRVEFNPEIDAGMREALDSLSALVSVTTSRNTDGTTTVLVGGSLPLVSEDLTWPIGVNPSSLPGSQVRSAGGGSQPPQLRGILGALLSVRNDVLSKAVGGSGQSGTLNELASGFASRVNALLASGRTPADAPGQPMFAWDNSDITNAARTLRVDTAFKPEDLALADPVSGQSNGVAGKLATLPSSVASADLIDGLPAEGYFGRIAADVGQRTANARRSVELDRAALTSAEQDRESISGVSLDREAVLLTAAQRAYEAAARFFTMLDKITETEVNLIR